MIIKEHTRNQKRMYRIHKMEEKIKQQDYIIGNLQSKIDKAIEYIINNSKEYKPHFRKIELNTKQCNELLNILEEDK